MIAKAKSEKNCKTKKSKDNTSKKQNKDSISDKEQLKEVITKLLSEVKDSKKPTLEDKLKSKDQEEIKLVTEELIAIDDLELEHEILEAQNFYSTGPSLEYADDPFYLENPWNKNLFDYEKASENSDGYVNNSETMTDKEAEAAVEQMAKEGATGVMEFENLNMRDRERFKNWQQDGGNKVLMFLYDGLSIIRSSNTDYGKTL
ncbi:MAG: hypothetical protein ABIG93_00090 [archaeon]|nr:hypothetical protein [Nanoarchaeota archaeon]